MSSEAVTLLDLSQEHLEFTSPDKNLEVCLRRRGWHLALEVEIISLFSWGETRLASWQVCDNQKVLSSGCLAIAADMLGGGFGEIFLDVFDPEFSKLSGYTLRVAPASEVLSDDNLRKCWNATENARCRDVLIEEQRRS